MSDTFFRRFALNINFAFALFVILVILYFTPPFVIDSDFYNSIYGQINFNSKHFEFFKLLFYLSTISLGYLLIKQISPVVNLPKRYFFGAFRNFFILFVYALIIYFFSGNTVLAGLYDTEGFCDPKGLESFTNHKNDGAIGNFLYRFMTDVKRIYSFKFLENLFNFYPHIDSNSGNLCVFPGFLEVIFLNYNLFIFPFFFGLNFFPVIESFQTLKYMKINWHTTKFWDKKHWITYYIMLGFFCINILFHFVNYARESIWKFGLFLILICLFSGYITLRYFKSKKVYLNVTSPTLLMLVLIFVNIHCVYEIIIFGFCNGMMVEASGSLVSWDIFKEVDLENYKSFNFVPHHAEIERRDEECLDK